MKVKDYETACLKFAADTQDRDSLKKGNFFQTIGGDWEETEEGDAGLSVKWAFHKTPDEIRSQAAQQFVNEILSEIDESPATYGDNETAVNFMVWLADILR